MRKISMLVGLFILGMTLSGGYLYAACTVTRGKVEVSQGTGSTCSSIQSAIDAAGGTNSVIISVLPGTYIENIVLKSNINLQGAGKDITILQAATPSIETVKIDTVNNTAISGFKILGGPNGSDTIWVNSSSPLIRDNYITGGWSGIYNSGSATPHIVENKITGNGHGIYDETSSPFIERNEIIDNNSEESGQEILLFQS